MEGSGPGLIDVISLHLTPETEGNYEKPIPWLIFETGQFRIRYINTIGLFLTISQ
jgi:hypothetical protein